MLRVRYSGPVWSYLRKVIWFFKLVKFLTWVLVIVFCNALKLTLNCYTYPCGLPNLIIISVGNCNLYQLNFLPQCWNSTWYFLALFTIPIKNPLISKQSHIVKIFGCWFLSNYNLLSQFLQWPFNSVSWVNPARRLLVVFIFHNGWSDCKSILLPLLPVVSNILFQA